MVSDSGPTVVRQWSDRSDRSDRSDSQGSACEMALCVWAMGMSACKSEHSSEHTALVKHCGRYM